MKAYKGFDKNLQCRGLQYEIGGTQEVDKVKLCNQGLHACEAPLDVFSYYAPGEGSRYCEVEMDGVSDERRDDSKRVAKKLTVGAEIGIPGLVKDHVEYVKAHTTMEHTDQKAATAGDSGAATAKGSVSVGKNGCGLVKIKGGLGAVLVICEENADDWDIKEWKAFVVDGTDIRADTWYKLVNGKLVEAE